MFSLNLKTKLKQANEVASVQVRFTSELIHFSETELCAEGIYLFILDLVVAEDIWDTLQSSAPLQMNKSVLCPYRPHGDYSIFIIKLCAFKFIFSSVYLQLNQNLLYKHVGVSMNVL